MNYLFLNLKRFDIERRFAGVNSIAPAREWGGAVASALVDGIAARSALAGRLSVAAFLPEAQLVGALNALDGFAGNSAGHSAAFAVGCQSVHSEDVAPGGNFGAFTTLRPASAMRQLGCEWAIVGHSEERTYLAAIMARAGAAANTARAVSEILGAKVRAAQKAGLKVLFCLGETAQEVPARREVLARQIESALGAADLAKVVLAYEPVWAIGPGKTPPSAQEIADIAADIKKIAACPLVYGGGLKKENAAQIGAISELNGGLVALTRFSGEIGFYPEEFFDILDLYAQGAGLGAGGSSRGVSHNQEAKA